MSYSDSSENEQNSYRCDICNRKFWGVYCIQNHVKIHVTDQSHRCDICSKQFICSDSLQRHKKNKHSTSKHERRYECRVCKKLFPGVKIKDHYYLEHNLTVKKPFQCTICRIEFSFPGNLQRHEKYAHQKGGKRPVHKCEFCDKQFASKYNLDEHLRIHTGNSVQFICDLCGKDYSDRSNFRRHRLSHERPRNKTKCDERMAKKHVCMLCNRGFSVPHRLKEHIARVHTGEKSHICNVCGKSYYLAYDLKRHSIVHTGEIIIKCDICGKGFSRTSSLNRHLKSHANEGEKHECSICGNTYTRLWTLQRHMTSHDGTEPFICSICGDKFIWKFQFTEHLADKHGIDSSSHKCLLCEKQFDSHRKLILHNQSHLSKKRKPLKSRVCEICGKPFKTLSAFKTHMRTHINERPYVCSVCNKAFSQSSTLNTHMKIHTGDNFHSCTVCNRYYTRAIDLENHLRKKTHIQMLNSQKPIPSRHMT